MSDSTTRDLDPEGLADTVVGFHRDHVAVTRNDHLADGEAIVVGWRAMNKPGVKVCPLLARRWMSTARDGSRPSAMTIPWRAKICGAELDGDGTLDFVAAGRATKNVQVYLNQGVGQ